MSEAAIITAVRGLVDTAIVAAGVKVHEDIRWTSQDAAFRSMFVDDPNDVLHSWMVASAGHEERVVGTNNLTIITHQLKIFGLYAVKDAGTGTIPTSTAAWRAAKAAVLDKLRKNWTLSGTAMNSGPLSSDEGHRAFHGKLVHWVEIDLPAQERVSYV